MIDYNKLTMLANYVLILPDAHLETYQMSGKETNLISPDFKYEKGEKISVPERNASVFGTVYGVPSSLNFNLDKIVKISDNNTLFVEKNKQRVPVNISLHRQLADLTRTSVLFDVPIEISKGDRVNFSYQAHKFAKEQNMIIDTELGEMYLIKYDMFYMTVDENLNPKKMLNGYVLVEPEHIEVKKEGAQEFIEQKHGLVTIAPKQTLKKTKKSQKGKIRLAGGICKRYLQEKEKSDYLGDLPLGAEVIYDPRRCQKLEYDTHQIMSDKVLHLLQRKDIYGVYTELATEIDKYEEAKKCLI